MLSKEMTNDEEGNNFNTLNFIAQLSFVTFSVTPQMHFKTYFNIGNFLYTSANNSPSIY